MTLKLALSGIRGRLRNLIVLLAGLVVSIAIFYMFQTMAWNTAFITHNAMINSIQLVYAMGSFLLAAVTLFYVIYAGGFLFSLRQREYGMYMTIGARRSRVRTVMLLEWLVIGGAAIVIGMALGCGLALLVSSLLANMLDTTFSGYRALYGPAVLFTVVFYVALLAVTALWSQLKLGRMRLLQLLRAGDSAERPARAGRGAFWGGLLGLGALLIGYIALTFMEQLREIGLLAATVMTPLGTYLLFMTWLPRLVRRAGRSDRRLAGIRAFTNGQLAFRVRDLSRMLATTALLVALGTGAIAGGIAFLNDAYLKARQSGQYDIVLENPDPQQLELLRAVTFEERHELRVKREDAVAWVARADLEAMLAHTPPVLEDGTVLEEALPGGQQAITWTSHPQWRQLLSGVLPASALGADEIRLADNSYFGAIGTAATTVWFGRSDDFLAYTDIWGELESGRTAYHWSKYDQYQDNLGLAGGTVFMGFFLGVAFLTMMASCLMFKILSGASTDARRYALLRKLGVRGERMRASIRRELGYLFLLPGAAGLLHVLVGMNLFAFILQQPYYRLWLPLLMFAVIYGLYYLVTVWMYNRLALPAPVSGDVPHTRQTGGGTRYPGGSMSRN
ncbi:ABC transporter permease [Paenibacillus sp. IB182496]|uniref:ABC transporter permease n=1 Tax=Paenibacillus sabuli TaxID=2772509 RepID=A0A927GTE0_9BACL|nr:ABC transporter permease [Paenibacillus sabuli]MBD2847724.1 ABC transporter permease [Paenibacillus sabuli]